MILLAFASRELAGLFPKISFSCQKNLHLFSKTSDTMSVVCFCERKESPTIHAASTFLLCTAKAIL